MTAFVPNRLTIRDICALSEEKANAFFDRLTPDEQFSKRYDWKFWARDEQLLPPGDWLWWLVCAGRGFGKTRTGAETVRQWVKDGFERISIIGATFDDAEKIMVYGESGILAVCPESERPRWVKNSKELRWPNGTVSLVFTAEEPDRLRGKQHSQIWCDELAAWRYPQAFDQAKLGLRLGRKPQAIITTTPRPTPIMKDLMKDPNTVITTGSTYANKANLSKAFHTTVIRKYEGLRMGRQELYAEMLEDTPGALWRREWFDEEGHRVTYKNLPQLTRIVVAIDPAVTTGEDADETGIICVGIDSRRHAYVLDDRSGHFTVDEWAKKATATYRYRKADCIVAEVNNGGDMVERVLRMHDNSIAYKKVHASRGKVIRAEPVAQLYEKRWVHHLGCFPKLEDQLCFPAGTLIETALGHIPIEKIRFGDLVMTRDGLFPVKIACETGCSSEFVVITTTDGGVLRCTPTHPIFDAETGQFVAAMNAKRGQRLNVRHSPANMAGRSLGVEGGGIECRRDIIGMRRVNYFTARYGRLIRDRFQKECMSIIRMRIHQITHLTTLLCSRLQNMFLSISREELLGSTGKLGCSMGSSHGESGFQKNSSAYIAARLEGPCGLQKENSATISALTDIIRRKRSRIEIVRSAGKRLWRGTRGRSTAIGDVSNLRTIEESVFNLKVDGPNEFYANGILVHNCSFTSDYIRSKGNSPDRLDALVFAISELLVEGGGYDESLSWIGV